MSDLRRGSPDDQFINVDDEDELRHWSRVLQTTPDVIKAAVCAVGSSAVKVRAHLELRTDAAKGLQSQPVNTRRLLSLRRQP